MSKELESAVSKQEARLSGAAKHGVISWMARHSVAANLLMLACIFGGLLFMTTIRQEVMPDYSLDKISIITAYPGASPSEIESGILLPIENALNGLDGIAEINSTAKEDKGTVIVDVVSGTDIQRLSQDIQSEVNRIDTFPEDAEEPEVAIMVVKRRVVSMVLYGQAEDKVLHELAEQFRDQLLQDKDITQVELEGIRPLEISISVPQENLRRYRLSLNDIAQRINAASIDLPGGSIKTATGEILIRMKERKDYGQQFAHLPIITTANGSQVLLGDIATIDDSYDDSDYHATYNGLPAVMVQVYRVGEQTPISVSDAVKRHIAHVQPELPAGIHAEIRYDASVDYQLRMNFLMNDSLQGLVLVIVMLAIFLELRLALWVMIGIPIAFFGAFLILPVLGVTLNMVSLFAFIIALGIVVDDAIVIGENVYHYRQQGMSPMQAAIKGAQEMVAPVTFSILINIATFVPLLFIPGEIGKIFYMIPLVIISVFIMSLVESLLILPNHLGQLQDDVERRGLYAWIYEHQQRFSRAFVYWVRHSYGAFLDSALRHRYLTITIALVLLISVFSYVLSGRMGMTLFPKTEADFANVTVTLPYGTPIAKTRAVVDRLIEAARETVATVPEGDKLVKGMFAEVAKRGSHLAEVRVYLAPPDVRENIMSTDEFTNRWRETVGEIIGVDSLIFESDAGGPGSGAAITIELNHRNQKILQQAGGELADALRSYAMIKDVNDGFSLGKQQLDFTVLPEGKSLGLTAQSVARQVRNAFYGAEVLRQQRGRNELKVMVRLPAQERVSEDNIEDLLIWTSTGREIPLREVVQIERTHADTEINRRNGRRNIQVEADSVPRSKAGDVLNDLEASELPRLVEKYPGLQYSFEGRQADMNESLGSLKISFIFALVVIYALLAIPFKSYALPFIVMVSIPFSVIGAILGHFIMGYDLSILSLFGIVALAGVVVNDSLILIDHAIYLQSAGGDKTALEIISTAVTQRFRQIVLTTLTTFGGLGPMIMETSRQAKTLIPMAISIGFGSLFATLITLVLIPSLYVVVDDVRKFIKRKKSPGD
ncbi:MAG: efflux RND transporter permease subunit [Methylococcaceae bacterium]